MELSLWIHANVSFGVFNSNPFIDLSHERRFEWFQTNHLEFHQLEIVCNLTVFPQWVFIFFPFQPSDLFKAIGQLGPQIGFPRLDSQIPDLGNAPARVNNTNVVCFEYRGLGWYYEHDHRVCWYFEHDHRVCWYFEHDHRVCWYFGRAVGILKWWIWGIGILNMIIGSVGILIGLLVFWNDEFEGWYYELSPLVFEKALLVFW